MLSEQRASGAFYDRRLPGGCERVRDLSFTWVIFFLERSGWINRSPVLQSVVALADGILAILPLPPPLLTNPPRLHQRSTSLHIFRLVWRQRRGDWGTVEMASSHILSFTGSVCGLNLTTYTSTSKAHELKIDLSKRTLSLVFYSHI